MQAQNRGASHNCQGPRCVCQRYENGELAAVMMNQGRSNQEREDGYQNTGHASRAFPNRAGNAPQVHPNLNPNYQNPIDLVRNYNRRQQQQEPEENIYERLDNEDDEDGDENAEVPRNESLAQNNQGNHADNHAYERLGERISCSSRIHCRYYKYHGLNQVPAPSFLNDVDGARNASQYDQPRHIYIDYSRLSGNLHQNSLSRLGRNCFSTENIAYASTRRSVQPLVYNCTCPYCRHVDARYICHHCHNLHNRLRQYQDAGNSRHYVYQVARNCRCPFCRGEFPYTKLPASALRAAELFKMECCHCRNPGSCTCRGKIPLDSNSAIYFGRYLDWINRTGQSVNNPLYAMIHVGRMDRASLPGHGNAGMSNGGSQPNAADPGPSTSNGVSSARFNDSNASSILRSIFAPGSSASNASICPVNRYVERQHTCDDSCIRSQSGSLAGICQLLGRCERTECNHGRLSVHWWFVNKWLPMWNSHNLDRNSADGAPCVDEVSREQRESDSDDS
ncbi:uncharacterized protein LOC113561826 [Ooceraea biroi]|uniref:uncharacterized protein LOC113561826 n=1 Tax=Ooceraea biroi TaxID=2015173 RepID=UPI000F099C60|nr:uncharacterized protein LOC113561826 [Ooceraea biroi]